MLRTLNYTALGLALAAALGLAAACSSRTPEPAGGAAPAPSETTATASRASPPTGPAPEADSAGTSMTRGTPAATPAQAGGDSGFVQYDAATKTVTFRLVAGPFDFNGFTQGGATLTIPPGSTNVWNFEQNDGTPHSAEVASGTGPVPSSGGDPAIPRAYTNKVVEGLPQGATDVIRFTAPDSGTYRIICGVPGHALSGMWLWLKVDPAAKTAVFGKS